MNIYIGNLPFSLEETELKEFFEEYGEVSSVKIITDKMTGRSKGFGFIEMPDEQALKAIEELNEAEVDGRSIVVKKAEEKKDTRKGGFNKGGFNKGGSGGFNKGGFNKGGFNKGGSGGFNKGSGNRRFSPSN